MNNTNNFDENELAKISILDPSGVIETNNELNDCAMRIVKKAKGFFIHGAVMAHVWSYRCGGYNVITCDLFSQDKKLIMPITISSGGRQVLDNLDGLEVFDMVEALHLVGIVTKKLNANVFLGFE